MPGEPSQFKGNLRITTRDDQSGGDLSVDGSLTVGNTDFGDKADKVSAATNGHLAALDSSGNLTDSGAAASDFADADHVHGTEDITGLGSAALLNAGTDAGEVLVIDTTGKISTDVLPAGAIWVTNTSSASTAPSATLADHNRYVFTATDIIRLTINAGSLVGEAVVTFGIGEGGITVVHGLGNVAMSGDDCVSGIWTPRVNTNYTIRFYGDGTRTVGNVTATELCIPEAVAGITPTVTPANGKRFNAGTLTALTIAAPVSFSSGERCQIYFTSHADGTSVTNSSGAVFSGANCSGGTFTPAASTDYLITFTKASPSADLTADVTSADSLNLLPVVIVSAPTGTEITVTNGTVTLTGTAEDSVCCFVRPAFGKWTISGAFDNWNADSNVILSADEAKTYTATLTFADLVVYGVRHYKTLSSSALERLGDAVGKSFTPAIVTETITDGVSSFTTQQNGVSGFDNAKIYKDIKLCNVVSGAATAYYGDDGFSFTPETGDVCVEIPRFYVRVDQTPTSTTWWISNKKGTGFVTSPSHMDRGDGKGERTKVYIGRYTSAAGFKSLSGGSPLTNTSQNDFRTGHTGRGTGYFSEDYLSCLTIILLYMVETANLNSQLVVGTGRHVVNNEYLNNGKTDPILYHSGKIYESGTNENTGAVVYRWIENRWGNIAQFLDGMTWNTPKMKFFINPSDYGNMTTSQGGRFITCERAENQGYIKTMNFSDEFGWAMYPCAVGGSSTTYFSDATSLASGQRAVTCGSQVGSATGTGIFHFASVVYSHLGNAVIGARLMILP